MRTNLHQSVLASCGRLLGVLILTVTPIACTEQASVKYESIPMSAEMASASDANGHFAVDLYRQLAETKSGVNIFLSPFSISLALTMTAEGAVDETLDQMTDVLHIPRGSLAKIHAGQKGLQSSAIPVAPPKVIAKIARLRAELQKSIDRSRELETAERFQEAMPMWTTQEKLRKEINMLLNRTSTCELQIANALWLDKAYPIQPDFISILKANYGANVFQVDFKGSPDSTCLQINHWVAEGTNNRIENLLTPESMSDLTKLLITNTVYFKGNWAFPFETFATHPVTFQQSAAQSIELPMMFQENSHSASYGAFESNGDLFSTPHEILFDLNNNDPSLYPDEQGHTMLALDYQGRKIQMIILVPQSATGIPDLEKRLTYGSLQRWIGQLERRTVNVGIPKYKLETTYGLTKNLHALGMVRPFEAFGKNPQNPTGAQFDKLSPARRPEDRLCISAVIHKTYLDVTETGTEAAAATAVTGVVSEGFEDRQKMRPFVPIFRANKPFIFLIRDRETASILFLGRYAGTSSSSNVSESP